jgi:hypothetical protein
MQFQKGQSGNPGGRRKADPELRAIAQQYTEEAVDVAVKVMRNSKAADSSRLKAVEILLDRGHGRPVQAIDATHRVITDPAELTYEELSEIARGGLGSAHGKPH